MKQRVRGHAFCSRAKIQPSSPFLAVDPPVPHLNPSVEHIDSTSTLVPELQVGCEKAHVLDLPDPPAGIFSSSLAFTSTSTANGRAVSDGLRSSMFEGRLKRRLFPVRAGSALLSPTATTAARLGAAGASGVHTAAATLLAPASVELRFIGANEI
jgi:hypothetical protein